MAFAWHWWKWPSYNEEYRAAGQPAAVAWVCVGLRVARLVCGVLSPRGELVALHVHHRLEHDWPRIWSAARDVIGVTDWEEVLFVGQLQPQLEPFPGPPVSV